MYASLKVYSVYYSTQAVKRVPLSGNITLGEEREVGAYQSEEVMKAKATAWI